MVVVLSGGMSSMLGTCFALMVCGNAYAGMNHMMRRSTIASPMSV